MPVTRVPGQASAPPAPDAALASISHLFGESRTPADQAAAGIVNDASGLVPVRPALIVQPRNSDEIRQALATARVNGLAVTMSGTRHAMGGQALRDGAVLLDMRAMDAMAYDAATDTLRVQPGATWDEVQRYLDPRGRSVAVMQSSNIFSVGGTLAANAHGRDVRFGPVIGSVKTITVMLPSGQVVHASRAENADLFRHVIGGYGLFGTIVSADLATVPNELYRRRDATMPVGSFLDYYARNVLGNPNARLLQGKLSVAPHDLFGEVHVVEYRADPTPAGGGSSAALPELRQHESALMLLWEKVSLQLAERSKLGRELLWLQQQYIEPRFNTVATRNQVMSPSTEFLRSGPSDHTQILQEYFVPRARLPQFVDRLRTIVGGSGVPVINATIRDVPADRESALAYSPDDRFAVVLYLDQDSTPAASVAMDQMARAAGQAAVAEGGSFYLPYALPFTGSQMVAAYPTFGTVMNNQRKADPNGMLRNGITDLAARLAM